MSAEPDQPLAHALQAKPRPGFREGSEAAAVVSDAQGDGVCGMSEVHSACPAPLCLATLAKRLLGDAEERLFHLRGTLRSPWTRKSAGISAPSDQRTTYSRSAVARPFPPGPRDASPGSGR